MSVNETAMQNAQSVHSKSVCRNKWLLGGHVVDESEKCGHIWDTTVGNQKTLEAAKMRLNSEC
jgi:hypothetical protein